MAIDALAPCSAQPSVITVARYWPCKIDRCLSSAREVFASRWRHNDHAGVSNHQPNGCLLNRLFRRRSKKTSNLRVTGLCAGNSPGPVNSPHKGPVTWKMFPFEDVIMTICYSIVKTHIEYIYIIFPGKKWARNWLIIIEVLWHLSEGNVTSETSDITS